MSADQKSDGLKKLLEGWIEQLKVIREEVRSLLLGAKIFWEVQKILEDNPRSLSHPLFNRWIASNYFCCDSGRNTTTARQGFAKCFPEEGIDGN